MAEHLSFPSHPIQPTLLLVDGHNLLHRAAFGFPTRITSRSGVNRTMVFGFFALLRAAMRQVHGDTECVVVFDGCHGAEERRQIEPRYKPPFIDGDPEAFADQPTLIEALRRFGVRVVEFDRYEADDIIATAVKRNVDRRDCVIMSTDRDFYQVLTDHCRLLNTARGVSERIVGPQYVVERYGVTTDQWCDYRALVGDPADGISGVRGVGPTRARSLLAGGGHLEDLSTGCRVDAPWATAVCQQLDQLRVWRDVIRLRQEVRAMPVESGHVTPELPPAPEVLAVTGLWD